MNVSILLQLATIAVAALGPFTAYHFSRRLTSTRNLEQWVEDLRNNVAECITHWQLQPVLYNMAHDLKDRQSKIAALNTFREGTFQLHVSQIRVRLLLRAEDPLHQRLLEALSNLAKERRDQDGSGERLTEVLNAAEAIIQQSWKEIQAGKRYRWGPSATHSRNPLLSLIFGRFPRVS